MAIKIIYAIRNGNSNTIRLFSSDGNSNYNKDFDIETGIDPDDVIIWTLAENSGLASLEGVVPTTGKGNPNYEAILLKENHVGMVAPSVYLGTVISPSVGIGKIQTYEVGFKVPGDDTTYWKDPKLIMKT